MTDIAELGEFGLIARLRRSSGTPPPPQGPGDDAALVAAPDGRIVATTDLLIEGVHFRRDWSSAYDIGRKAAAQNLADVAAMGARPTTLLVGFGAPAGFSLEDFDAFGGGVRAECAAAGATLVGGDLVEAPQLVVSGTALGVLDGAAPVLRSGARPGDVIGIVGRLGWASAGLRQLRAGQLDGVLVYAHRRPQPPYAAGPALAAAGASAMCDVSDGLLGDLGHIAEASQVTAAIRTEALRALGTAGVTDDDLLTGGEDHALVFTIAEGVQLPEGAVLIGQVQAGAAGVLVDGKPPSIKTFQHFGRSAASG
jgi:thiamine-monophosphate kinase